MRQLIHSSAWIIPALLLFIVAWVRFNSPPTNRSGTTFAMFFSGLIFYYALILALWLLVIIAVSQGSIGLDRFYLWLEKANPEAQGHLAQFSPVVAALFIVVAAQFPWVYKIDTAARAFCVNLAAIPREADRLTLELAQSADFQPGEPLRRQVTELILKNIGSAALNFTRDGTLSARFTKAVGLYWLFIGPYKNGTKTEFASFKGRSAYARIMQHNEATASRSEARYEELMQAGLAYFKSPQESKEFREALTRNTREVSNLSCSLIARYVLAREVTRSGRRQRLSNMGFDANRAIPSFGRDQWVTTILAVTLLSVAMMAFMPLTRRLSADQILTISATFGLSIGFAVSGAVLVARRFMERHGDKPAYPPIAELTLAALIVAGLTVVLRIGIPLVPALIQGGISRLPDIIAQFVQRWPGTIVPFFCTISLGLLCCYLGSRRWSWISVAAVGALGNWLAFIPAGLFVAWMLDDSVLRQFYDDLDLGRRTIVISTSFTGLVIGAIVLAQFKRSERARKEIIESAANSLPASSPGRCIEAPAEDLEGAKSRKSETARQNFGGYSRSQVLQLEGRYVCFRPTFTSTDVITAYLIIVRWDDAESCLLFEEESRADAGHTQRGRVYLPEDQPLMSFVTVERGAIRLITVSRPENQKPARGLIMTLSNPSGTHFTPATAPVVLRRLGDNLPQLGFISPEAPDYEAYRQELETVVPKFGVFAPSLGTAWDTARLSIVR